MALKYLSLAVLSIIISAFAGCGGKNVVVKINDMALSPNVRMVSIPGKNLKMYYHYVRFFKKKIEADGNVEYVTDNEPLAFDSINRLPENTESAGLNIYIENPGNKKYRLTSIEMVSGSPDTRMIYEGIRNDNYLVVRASTDSDGVSGLKVRLELMENGRPAGMLETAEFKYSNFNSKHKLGKMNAVVSKTEPSKMMSNMLFSEPENNMR